MNLAANLSHGDPQRIALKLDKDELTYAELDERSAQFAAWLLGRGFEAGDRLALQMPNLPFFVVAYYGTLRAGGVVVPMNPLLKEREVAYYLEDSGAREHVTGEFELPAAADRAVAERDGSDTAVILYTSGTTGKPKGAELTHANLCRNVEVVTAMWNIGADDVILGALPLFHSFGQTCGMNAAIAAGATLTLVARFEPGKVLEVLERDGVTMFEGVPTMYGALLHHPDAARRDTRRLRLCISGGASLPVELLRSFDAQFECKILEGYGLSETSPVASFNHPDAERRPGSIGTPIAGVEMKVVGDDGADLPAGEVGEIVIRGHNVMKGYWARPDATEQAIDADGWFRTGDMARTDEDGYFFIVDRKKDLIIRGGYNVYPREVEEVLYEHAAVREAAVVAVAHEELGEEVGAAIALKEGAEASAEELRQFVKDRIAAYKYPRHIWFVDELPKGPTGKILKREIAVPEHAQTAR